MCVGAVEEMLAIAPGRRFPDEVVPTSMPQIQCHHVRRLNEDGLRVKRGEAAAG